MAKHRIINEYVRSRELAPSHEAACEAVAQLTGLEFDTVLAVVDEHLALSHEELA
ncbi:hypothetical protein [Variovorax sp. UMC13]|uniref:hypothetical protein n=1 Tax=Variovorax sp. UMC13 TaxID=1862326 RepID=UPI001601F53E|nr:hypothetical protein [Variovorax sp. UMC13]